MTRVDLSLRQAILLNDVALVQRILQHNLSYLQNPDFADKSNTSLHLAAKYGLEEIAEFLISLGHDGTRPVEDWIYSAKHDNRGISVNTDGQTPLHLAAASSQAGVVELLCREFPQTVNRRDRKGQTPLHLAASSQIIPKPNFNNTANNSGASRPTPEDNRTIEILLTHGADVNAKDELGNTCLHNASAWGNLKAIRALIQAGADPLSKNKAGWTPEYYSITVQAEVYYRNLVAEWEKRKAEDEMRASSERRGKGGGSVRLVPQENESDGEGDESSRTETSRERSTTRSPVPNNAGAGAGSVVGTSLGKQSDAGLGISVGYVDAWK
ncbi:uncharacterized protein Z520_10687 [Fonsecaea multimorphosa CBS 102226]|uniref:Uncharacterized protein n=1 Tax=Fonsecaea multimorphosa CBS 102226 TaxID=1442371 RepID=A0A0D2JSR6_9EURO|nr:uncharacterized protein Z520_10687 [Fonsecaea multimorphosa CBS 102226]KIX93509.1 hypothetical protein Z520_10687 [Fonsecaea multimorphosa CBS 102226]OAL18825.1 hypothetical protein AYO22_10154 [Fonsecaea multimorphosa]